jgi:uncharacterized protein (TIGR02466 family)
MSNYIKDIFATPIMIVDSDNHDDNKTLVMECVEKFNHAYPLRKETRGNILSLEKFRDLKTEIEKHCIHYFRMVCGVYVKPEDIIISNSWLNCITNNVKLSRHAHRNSHISGVYYVNYDYKVDPPIIFNKETLYNTGNPLEAFFHIDPERDTPYNAYSHELKIKEGQMCLFNSYLCHSHESKQSSGNRVSLAFNCVLKHYISGSSDQGMQYEVFIQEKQSN